MRRGTFLALVLGALYVSRAETLPWLSRFFNVGQTPVPVEYVLVLNGNPQTRPFVAAAMYNSGLAGEVLVTQAGPTPETEDGLVLREDEIIRQVLVARGVPVEKIRILPGEIASTYDEARSLQRFLDQRPGATFAVVTDDFHTRRARWIFHKVLEGKSDWMHFVAAPLDDVQPETWWRTERGATIYLSELVKFAYYVVRYGRS
ncbi:MAG: YdcF family protein [Planctomycetes bacterium]|nr:YdcF family protein [Planctomycetota bacterium]